MPLGKLIHSYDQDAVALWNANLEEGLKIAHAAGAKEAWSARGSIPTSHLMGGTIMGTDPSTSVVNPYLQHWQMPNLFMTGGSTFPQSGSGNPTLTIIAMTYRSVDALIDRYLKNPGALA